LKGFSVIEQELVVLAESVGDHIKAAIDELERRLDAKYLAALDGMAERLNKQAAVIASLQKKGQP
jgi:hypothetical protein